MNEWVIEWILVAILFEWIVAIHVIVSQVHIWYSPKANQVHFFD